MSIKSCSSRHAERRPWVRGCYSSVNLVPRARDAYFGLSDELAMKPEVTPKECLGEHHDNITIIDGKTAVHSSNDKSHEYVLGSNVYSEGVIQWKLKLESFQVNHWMFVGIMEGVPNPYEFSARWPGSYGFALGSASGIYTNGNYQPSNSLKNLTKQGDTVTLTLDCSSSKLSILTAGQTFHQTLQSCKTWRLSIGLYEKNDKIRIV